MREKREPITLEELKFYRDYHFMARYLLRRQLAISLIETYACEDEWPDDVPDGFKIPADIEAMSEEKLETEKQVNAYALQKYEKTYKIISAKIASIKSDQMRAIIEYRYRENCTWRGVAELIGDGMTEEKVRSKYYDFMKREKQKALST